MNNLSEFLRQATEAQEEAQRCKALPEAQVASLREMHGRYRLLSFYAGQLITPAALSGIVGAGQPHLVLESRDVSQPLFNSKEEGTYLDVRVAWMGACGHVHTGWFEGWRFEPYAGPA